MHACNSSIAKRCEAVHEARGVSAIAKRSMLFAAAAVSPATRKQAYMSFRDKAGQQLDIDFVNIVDHELLLCQTKAFHWIHRTVSNSKHLRQSSCMQTRNIDKTRSFQHDAHVGL